MEKQKLEKLIFIYNANAGIRNALLDGAHKIVSPATYTCKLCSITYGAFREKKIWKRYRTQHDLPMEFLYKDGFTKAYASKFGSKFTFPIVLGVTVNGLEVYIKTEELVSMNNTEDLIKLLEERT